MTGTTAHVVRLLQTRADIFFASTQQRESLPVFIAAPPLLASPTGTAGLSQLGGGVEAFTVVVMSSCRSTSFYLAPSVLRYFRNHTLVAVLPDGTWAELQHRNDIARLQEQHPRWDGSVLCGPPGGVAALRTTFLDTPASVERWQIDTRVVEGRRPPGAAYPVWRFYLDGVSAVGGPRQLADALFKDANKPLKHVAAAMAAANRPGAALRLSIAAALQGVLSDDEMVAILRQPSILDEFRFAPVNPSIFSEEFRLSTEWLDEAATKRCARALMTGRDRPAIEVGLAASSTDNPGLLEAISSHTSVLVRVGVAGNPSAPAELLRYLARDQDPAVRSTVATNPSAPAELLRYLARDQDPAVRSHIGGVTGAPMDVLAELAKDKDVSVRSAVANNGSSPAAVLAHLARDEAAKVLHSVAANPCTPGEVLRELVSKKQEDLVGWHGEPMCQLIAANPATPPDLLDYLAQEGSSRVQKIVAANQRTSPASLAALATHPDQDVACIVARNQATPRALLASLAEHPSCDIRAAVVCNPTNTSAQAAEILATLDDLTKLQVAMHHDTPESVLMILANEDDERIGRGILRRKRVPTAVLEVLAGSSAEASQLLIAEQGRISASVDKRRTRWDMYDADDFHEAVFASEEAIVDHPIVGELRGAAAMVGHPRAARQDPRHVRTVRDLPGYGSVPWVNVSNASVTLNDFSTSIEASDLGLDRTGKKSLTARVLDSQAAIEANAEYMGNCTSGYISSVARGTSLLVALDDDEGRCQMNINLIQEAGAWVPGEINTRFNGYGWDGEHTPKDAHRIAAELAARMNSAPAGRPPIA